MTWATLSPPAPGRPTWRGLLSAGLLGLVFGLLYGWVLRPVEYFDTSPDSLRADYRADYVLMVAEAYQAEADLSRAVQRLAALGPTPAFEIVSQALGAAHLGFSQTDRDRLSRLARDLRALAPTPEIGGP